VDAGTFKRPQRIREKAQRMGLLIDDLLRLSRVSQREIDRRDFDLSALAADVVANLRRTGRAFGGRARAMRHDSPCRSDAGAARAG
jgi:signal transduction histidine kinase